MPVRYHTAASLVAAPTRPDGQSARQTPLLIIDELRLWGASSNHNIEFSGWAFGDPNMAAAIIDRTVHHGRMIRFEGESWRKTHALMQ